MRAGLYLVFGVLLAACNVLFDYAKIRAVVEDRRSMIGALLAAWRFLRRNPLHAAGLYLLNGLLFVAVIACTRWWRRAPERPGGRCGWGCW